MQKTEKTNPSNQEAVTASNNEDIKTKIDTAIKNNNEVIHKEFNDIIKTNNDRNFKKEIAIGIILVILTAFATYTVDYILSEKYVDITSSQEIVNGTAVIKLYNNAQRHSTSQIKIHGKVGDQDKIVKVIDNEILKPQDTHGLTIEIPLAVRNETLPLERLPDTPLGCNLNAQSWNIPMGKVFEANQLLYRVECDRCKNTDEWKIINSPRTEEVYSTISNIGGQLSLSIQYPHYTWE